MPWAIRATGTNDASLIAASGTKRTPSGKAPTTRAASAIDNLVLPQPPGPVRVSSLLSPKKMPSLGKLALPAHGGLCRITAADPAHPRRR